ncbi:hypothetical protein ACOSQ2_003391 [Xanthoceras sorbifolium]
MGSYKIKWKLRGISNFAHRTYWVWIFQHLIWHIDKKCDMMRTPICVLTFSFFVSPTPICYLSLLFYRSDEQFDNVGRFNYKWNSLYLRNNQHIDIIQLLAGKLFLVLILYNF